MSIGYKQFHLQLVKVENLLTQATLKADPGRWLYKHDLRTPLFMLEGLCRIYSTLQPTKKLKKLGVRFKSLEDSIGALDYYFSFEKEFAQNKAVPLAIRRYLKQSKFECEQRLNSLLTDDQWLNGKRIKKVKNSLEEIIWIEKEKQELETIAANYRNEIKSIEVFAAGTKFVFKDVEEDLHEIRRRIRWLSIYPQALGGAIQLKEIKPIKILLKKYLTPDIISSPYNQLPISPELKNFIFFDKHRFLALSWTISVLGKLKDQGLRMFMLEEAYKNTKLVSTRKIPAEIQQLLGKEYPNKLALLNQASQICKTFFKERNLDLLILK